jgi:hypothetical protein
MVEIPSFGDEAMNCKLPFTAGFAAAAFLIAASYPAMAADVKKELSTAITHAGMAAGSGDIKMVQTHLHHVINCLVGPSGAGFDAGQANPCKDQGMGAIPDSPANKQKELQAVVGMAQTGIAETDLTKAKDQAMAVENALKKAEM